MTNIRVEYVREGHGYNGTVLVGDEIVEAFDCVPFEAGVLGAVVRVLHGPLVVWEPLPTLTFLRLDDHVGRVLEVDEQVVLGLKSDPVHTMRAIAQGLAPLKGERGYPMQEVLRSGLDTLADAFGERVYLAVAAGSLVCPQTGSETNLAWGERVGWRVRGPGLSAQQWLPCRLEGASATEQDMMRALAGVRWVSASVEDLLGLEGARFYLPREWAFLLGGSGWVERTELASLLDRFVANKKESSRWQE